MLVNCDVLVFFESLLGGEEILTINNNTLSNTTNKINNLSYVHRGKPTCHVVYGEDVAILAGDSLLSSAFEYAIKYTPIPSISGENKAERLLDVVGRLGASVGNIGLAGGQVMDLECEGKPSEEVTIEDLRWIHLHKTAALLKVACASGAILGGGEETVTGLNILNFIGQGF